jgi:hypothetical protein
LQNGGLRLRLTAPYDAKVRSTANADKAIKKRRIDRLCENVPSDGYARQKQAKKRSLRAVNEHFEPVFNAA